MCLFCFFGLLFLLFFVFGVIWPGLWGYKTVSPHAAICMLFMKKNKKARGLITYKYSRVYSHIVSVAGVTSSWFCCSCCARAKRLHILLFITHKASVLYQRNKSYIQWKLHLKCVMLSCQRSTLCCHLRLRFRKALMFHFSLFCTVRAFGVS